MLLITPFLNLFNYSSLIKKIVSTDLKTKNAGTVLGNFWYVLSPLFLLGIYSLVYVYIFKLQPHGMDLQTYILYIFSGLVPFLGISETMSSGAQSLKQNQALLTNIAFPLEVLPVKSTTVSTISFVYGLIIVTLCSLWLKGPSLALLALPLVLVLQFLMMVGIAYILSPLMIFVKDMQYLITYLIMMLMIGSPISYTPDMLPEALKPVLYANPFAYLLQVYQNILAFQVIKWEILGMAALISLFLFFIGYYGFEFVKKAAASHV